jgi:hypothetical protein
MKNDMEKMVCHHVVDQFRERLVVVVLLQNLDEQNQDVRQSSLVLADVVLVLNVAVHFRERQVWLDEMLDVDHHLKMDYFHHVVARHRDEIVVDVVDVVDVAFVLMHQKSLQN